MKAVVIKEHGGPEALLIEERSISDVGPGEVRVKVKAASLNHLDLWVRRGMPGVELPLPLVPGCDGAGEINAVGEGVTDLEPGDPVIIVPGSCCGKCHYCLDNQDQFCAQYQILGEHCDGTLAEYITLPQRSVIPIPQNPDGDPILNMHEAAALPLVFTTAWHMVVARAQVQADETVLVHAAGSGVSSAALQIAKLKGAKVIATAGADHKLKKAKQLGADHCINYNEQDFLKEVKQLTKKRGVDVIIEHLGQEYWEKNIRALANGGRLVTCGATSGFEAKTDLRHVFFRSLSILGSTMGSKAELEQVLKHVVQGELKPIIYKTYKLEDIQAAHRAMEDRQVVGKMIIEVS